MVTGVIGKGGATAPERPSVSFAFHLLWAQLPNEGGRGVLLMQLPLGFTLLGLGCLGSQPSVQPPVGEQFLGGGVGPAERSPQWTHLGRQALRQVTGTRSESEHVGPGAGTGSGPGTCSPPKPSASGPRGMPLTRSRPPPLPPEAVGACREQAFRGEV